MQKKRIGHYVRKTDVMYSNYQIIVVVFTFKSESISQVLTTSVRSSNYIENARTLKQNVVPHRM